MDVAFTQPGILLHPAMYEALSAAPVFFLRGGLHCRACSNVFVSLGGGQRSWRLSSARICSLGLLCRGRSGQLWLVTGSTGLGAYLQSFAFKTKAASALAVANAASVSKHLQSMLLLRCWTGPCMHAVLCCWLGLGCDAAARL